MSHGRGSDYRSASLEIAGLVERTAKGQRFCGWPGQCLREINVFFNGLEVCLKGKKAGGVVERDDEVWGKEAIRKAVIRMIQRRGLMNIDDPELLDGSVANAVINDLREGHLEELDVATS